VRASDEKITSLAAIFPNSLLCFVPSKRLLSRFRLESLNKYVAGWYAA